MGSNDILAVTEQLSNAELFSDASDLKALARAHGLFEELSVVARAASQSKIADAAVSGAELLESLILGEIDAADAAIDVLNTCAADLAKLARGESASLSIPKIADFRTADAEVPVHQTANPAHELPSYIDESILAEFLSRQDSVIDAMEATILSAEKSRSPEKLEELKGIVHTLKGEVAFLGMRDVERLCHAFEDLLSEKPLSQCIDTSLSVCDWLGKTFRYYAGAEDAPKPDEAIFSLIRAPESVQTEADAEQSSPAPPQESPDHTEARVMSPESLAANRELLKEFIVEAHEHLENADIHLLKLETDPEDPSAIDAIFRAFHTIKGVAGFLDLPSIQAVSHESENLLDKARKGEIHLAGGVLDAIFDAVDTLNHLLDNVSAALDKDGHIQPDPHVPELLARLSQICAGTIPPPPDSDVQGSNAGKKLGKILVESGLSSPDKIETALARQVHLERRDKLGEILVTNSIISRAQLEEAIELQDAEEGERQLGEILIDIGAVLEQDIERALEMQNSNQDGPKIGEILVRSDEVPAKKIAQAVRSQRAPERQNKKRIRVSEAVKVDAKRLDRLVDAVGELVIAKSIVSQSLTGDALLDTNAIANLGQLDKITRELQEIGMSLRMVPIRPTFQKMARLVRDLAKKSGKNVEFVTSGEETELDKSIVDKISDPLVHLVRNAVDHGLETSPEERTQAGKPQKGTVHLRAYHRGGNIYIDIQDDGRGLDKEKILNKAVERGLIRKDENLSDKDIFNLIFEAGFSTASAVTDVSGRGVGMDVVRKNVESLRGHIDIQSEPGKGSTFSIRLPLTLAIIDGMVIRVGRERLVLPTLSILVSLNPTADELSTVVQRGLVLSHQGEVIPVHKLGPLFGIQGACDDPTEAIIIIVEEDGKKMGLLTDELLGQQQIVIKSLGQYLGSITGLAGGAIMSDGKVGLIVDIGGLRKLANQN